MNSDTVCLITARKGSQRLPGKNRMLLENMPLYEYTVRAAVESGVFARVVFSTDDEIILDDLKRDWPNVVADRRPAGLCTATANIWQAALDLLARKPELFDGAGSLCFLTPCHPLRTAEHVRLAFTEFEASGADSLVSITPYPCPPEFACSLLDGRLRQEWSGPLRKDTLEKRYYPNGAIYCVRLDAFVRDQTGWAGETAGFVLEYPDGLDIDEARDFEFAARFLRAGFGSGHDKEPLE